MSTIPSFSALGTPAPLVAALTASGITEPFPIQVDTLPDTLNGRDVLGRGKTGSGKTLAFSIPMIARLGGSLAGGRRRPGRPLGLVLAPTRELATQITAAMQPLADAYGIVTTTIFGGVSQQRQVAALKQGVDIVVACPGRLEDLMKQGFVNLDAVEITVLDEADHMADLGFLPVVTRILDKTPRGGQRLLFSATLDNGVDKLVKKYLQNEVLHSVDEANSPVALMTHHVFEVDGLDSKNALVKTLASGTGRRILFMRTKHHAKKLAKQLTGQGIPAVDLHGNLSQVARDRNLAAFGAGTVKVLVATDVAARGVHVDDVELVIHVDPPMEHKAYLHRSGRTARAGSEGDVVTVVLPTQRGDVKTLLRKAAIQVTPQQVTADSAAVSKLVGDVAAYVTPTAVVEPARGQSQGGRSQGANAQRKRVARTEGGAAPAAAAASARRPRLRPSPSRAQLVRGRSPRRRAPAAAVAPQERPRPAAARARSTAPPPAAPRPRLPPVASAAAAVARRAEFVCAPRSGAPRSADRVVAIRRACCERLGRFARTRIGRSPREVSAGLPRNPRQACAGSSTEGRVGLGRHQSFQAHPAFSRPVRSSRALDRGSTPANVPEPADARPRPRLQTPSEDAAASPTRPTPCTRGEAERVIRVPANRARWNARRSTGRGHLAEPTAVGRSAAHKTAQPNRARQNA
ncbi:DEAD/DEAH box helicase [Rathayibacter sp. VKM Ac-2759]|uniref:DEAD/DEAH box helicase n=1 Tax=Rathayibacter sp. VKM Ac-2759 TaxID=2609252 RepID=UPI001FC95BFD|nr:DEAD/DEAH box helicase [Rathayibacter sp. VKM Ac-2759]